MAIQGVLQGFGEIYTPLIISVLRLLFPVLPPAWLFTRGENAAALSAAFPVSEMIAAVAGLFLFLRLRRARKQEPRPETNANEQSAAACDL